MNIIMIVVIAYNVIFIRFVVLTIKIVKRYI